MNEKEIGEIRRRIRRDRSNMTAIYGCYVNDQKQIISQYRSSTAMMSENEGEKYFSLMKKALSGTLGKNLLNLSFTTAQVADSSEHKLLMDLKNCALQNDELRNQLIQKIIDSVSMEDGYLILLGCETYDVPFKGKDGQWNASEDSYTYILCAVCPVKQAKGNLLYKPEEKEFHDGGITQVAMSPALGFLFPAFDDRAANIYNTLFYTRDTGAGHEEFLDKLFRLKAPKPAKEQKKSFEGLLCSSLKDECSLEVMQAVHDTICQRIELHKESKDPETLMISKEEIKYSLESSGVSSAKVAKFSVDFDETFGLEADLHPKNIIDNKKFEIHTPDVAIRVAPDRSDLIETRVIGGVKYILIPADEDVEVNGVPICIHKKDFVEVIV